MVKTNSPIVTDKAAPTPYITGQSMNIRSNDSIALIKNDLA